MDDKDLPRIHFLQNAISISNYYKSMGENALRQLSEVDIHFQYHTNDNNIAILVKHIGGNLRSRWTDFQKSDGEKPWRNRETEFEDDLVDIKHVFEVWDHGWMCFLLALKDLRPEELCNEVFIRKEKHSVLEAIQRQLNHNAYHVGQLLYLAKSICGEKWKNQSIARGGSEAFNERMAL